MIHRNGFGFAVYRFIVRDGHVYPAVLEHGEGISIGSTISGEAAIARMRRDDSIWRTPHCAVISSTPGSRTGDGDEIRREVYVPLVRKVGDREISALRTIEANDLDPCRLERSGIAGKEDDLKKQMTELTTAQESLRSDIGTIQMERLFEKSDTAYFDMASKGYSKIDHNNGFFLVSFVDAKPKGDGQALTFRFGNPLATEYEGVKFKVRWGPRVPRNLKGAERMKATAEAAKQMQEMEITLTERLAPGAWNPVTFVVAPASAEKTGTIVLSEMFTNQIYLRK